MPYKDKKKQRQYQRNWKKERRKQFFLGKMCKWCDSTEKLVLHHIDPNKKEAHSIWSWSKKRRDREVEKCIVLCHSCHMDYHKPITVKHGNRLMYKNHGCRCDRCRQANTEYGRMMSLKRKLKSQR